MVRSRRRLSISCKTYFVTARNQADKPDITDKIAANSNALLSGASTWTTHVRHTITTDIHIIPTVVTKVFRFRRAFFFFLFLEPIG
ncbi:hypothetical protein SAMN05216324_13010 [Chryseobacterium limigenitum]|uniref:Uncharacterized protein n=1 Tax=Chryseobacterium limigenitum TaxID=1612149 RepID=A0A1K2IWW1_9FLAO|nr:hypothetical protein SAMN05216324_13010 [Chryseobacterium limigenitum]